MIKDYLTEDLLGKFLEERFNVKFERDKTAPDSGIRLRPNYRNGDLKLIIEFDGYRHYSCSSVIVNDLKKDNIYKELGYDIIRIPYFIQLDSAIINLLFGKYNISCSSFNNYPHGFIDKKCLLPCDFNYIGYDLFKYRDIEKFSVVKEDILNSLKSKYRKYGDGRLVAPIDFIELYKLYE